MYVCHLFFAYLLISDRTESAVTEQKTCMRVRAGIKAISFPAEERWHLWQLRLSYVSFASRGATSSRTGRRVALHVRKRQLVCAPRQFWHFSICCYDHRRSNGFIYVNWKKTPISFRLMWKYLIDARAGPVLKNTWYRQGTWTETIMSCCEQLLTYRLQVYFR